VIEWVEIRGRTFVPKTLYDDLEGSIGPYRFKVRLHRFDPGRKKSKCTCVAVRTGIQEKKVVSQSPALLQIVPCSAPCQLVWRKSRRELGLVSGSGQSGNGPVLLGAIYPPSIRIVQVT
jgi:hypothetical protein